MLSIQVFFFVSACDCDHLVGEEGPGYFAFSFVCIVCIVRHRLYTLALGSIDRLCSVIVAVPRHLFYFNEAKENKTKTALW